MTNRFTIRNASDAPLILNAEPGAILFSLPAGESVAVSEVYTNAPLELTFESHLVEISLQFGLAMDASEWKKRANKYSASFEWKDGRQPQLRDFEVRHSIDIQPMGAHQGC